MTPRARTAKPTEFNHVAYYQQMSGVPMPLDEEDLLPRSARTSRPLPTKSSLWQSSNTKPSPAKSITRKPTVPAYEQESPAKRARTTNYIPANRPVSTRTTSTPPQNPFAAMAKPAQYATNPLSARTFGPNPYAPQTKATFNWLNHHFGTDPPEPSPMEQLYGKAFFVPVLELDDDHPEMIKRRQKAAQQAAIRQEQEMLHQYNISQQQDMAQQYQLSGKQDMFHEYQMNGQYETNTQNMGPPRNVSQYQTNPQRPEYNDNSLPSTRMTEQAPKTVRQDQARVEQLAFAQMQATLAQNKVHTPQAAAAPTRDMQARLQNMEFQIPITRSEGDNTQVKAPKVQSDKPKWLQRSRRYTGDNARVQVPDNHPKDLPDGYVFQISISHPSIQAQVPSIHEDDNCFVISTSPARSPLSTSTSPVAAAQALPSTTQEVQHEQRVETQSTQPLSPTTTTLLPTCHHNDLNDLDDLFTSNQDVDFSSSFDMDFPFNLDDFDDISLPALPPLPPLTLDSEVTTTTTITATPPLPTLDELEARIQAVLDTAT